MACDPTLARYLSVDSVVAEKEKKDKEEEEDKDDDDGEGEGEGLGPAAVMIANGVEEKSEGELEIMLDQDDGTLV